MFQSSVIFNRICKRPQKATPQSDPTKACSLISLLLAM